MQINLVLAGQRGSVRTALLHAIGLAPGEPRPASEADGPAVCVIDADAHAELVRAMLAAGPLGIDAYLLVVAVDAGITDETREHAALLRALGVESGLAVVTGTDLADPDDVLLKTRQLFPGRTGPCRRPADRVRPRHAPAGRRRAASRRPLHAPGFPPPGSPAAGRRVETRVIDAALDFGPNREREPVHGTAVLIHLRGATPPPGSPGSAGASGRSGSTGRCPPLPVTASSFAGQIHPARSAAASSSMRPLGDIRHPTR